MSRSELENIKNRITSKIDTGSNNLVKIIFKKKTNTKTKLTNAAGDDLGVLSGSKIISCWVNSDFEMNGTISSQPLNTMGLFSAAGKLSTYIQKAGGALKNQNLTEENLADVIGLPPAGTQFGGSLFTEEIWQSTNKPSFSLNLIFINTHPKDDIMMDCTYLMSSVLPSEFTTMTMKPPIFFKDKTIDVRVGDWFWAKDLLITGVNTKFSKEIIRNGQPLYATVAVSFRPFRMPDQKTFLSWFTKRSDKLMPSITVMKVPGS